MFVIVNMNNYVDNLKRENVKKENVLRTIPCKCNIYEIQFAQLLSILHRIIYGNTWEFVSVDSAHRKISMSSYRYLKYYFYLKIFINNLISEN